MQESAAVTAADPSLSPSSGKRRLATQASRLLLCALVCLPLSVSAQLGAPADGSGSGALGSGLRLPGTSGASAAPASPDRANPSRGAAPATAPSVGQERGGFEPIDRVVAVVNQGVITQSELDAQMHLFESRAAANQVASLPPRDEMRKQVLEQLILQLAQEQFAADYGLKPSDAEIDRAAADVAQNNGLSLSQLEERLKTDGVPYESFRRQLTAEIVALRLRERETANSVSISEGEVDAELAKSGKVSEPEFNVRQILVKVPESATPQEVERLRARAESLATQAREGADFATLALENTTGAEAGASSDLGWRTASRLPSLFADTVRTMKAGDISAPVRSPAGFHVLKLQDRRAGQAASVQVTHARHILLPADSPQAEEEAVRRLELYRRDIEAGKADFARLAREFSADGSAAKGGDLGWLHPGETVPEFEQAMNALPDGGISEPVRSPFGVHLVQVLGRRTDVESPERLRNAARQKLRTTKGAEAYDQWLKELRDRTYVEYRTKDS